MNASQKVFIAFCDYAVARLDSGQVDPKELEQFVKFLKDQGIQEPQDIPESDVNPTLAKSFAMLSDQRSEAG